MRPAVEARCRLIAFVALAAMAIAGCGDSGGAGGGLVFRAVWEQPLEGGGAGQDECADPPPMPGSGFDRPLPPSVGIVQIVLESSAGASCCIRFEALNDERTVALAGLPAGPASLTISGFANSVDTAATGLPLCELAPNFANPPSNPCAGRAGAPNPSFSSDPIGVTILSAGTTDAGVIPIYSLPFLLLSEFPSQQPLVPPLDGLTNSSSAHFEVVSARGGVRASTIELTVFRDGRPVMGSPLPVPQECSDDPEVDASPCTRQGVLQVDGFSVSGEGLIPGGSGFARARIAAEDCAGRTMSFEYGFEVILPSPTPTFTPTLTSTPTITPTPTFTTTPTLTSTTTFTPTPTITPTATPPVVLRILATPAAPGELSQMAVVLESVPADLVGRIDLTIDFSPSAAIRGVLGDGFLVPDCTEAPALFDLVSFAFEPECDPAMMPPCTTLLAFIGGGGPITPMTLFTCVTQVAVGVTSGDRFPLTCEEETQDTQEKDVIVNCVPGEIRIP
jgi:hypothetical protein